MPALTKTIDRAEPALAVLWDDSHLWGLMLVRALSELGYSFRLLRSSHIARGGLQVHPARALLVPGGWSASKAAGLGRSGLEAIRAYVRSGGWYIGFCGGAGFALSTGDPESCLGLCSWGRKSMQDRLPNCSGHISLQTGKAGRMAAAAPVERLLAPVWWPSQFKPEPGQNQPQVLANYLSPGPDFWVADLPFTTTDRQDLDSWETTYGINLNPDILQDEPAIVTGRYGAGSYLLSYVHLETPASPQANSWLANILGRLAPPSGDWADRPREVSEWDIQERAVRWPDAVLLWSRELLQELVASGRKCGLLSWRKPWLLGWKRGLPGFSLNALLAMVAEAAAREPGPGSKPFWEAQRDDFAGDLQRFCELFTSLIETEGSDSQAPQAQDRLLQLGDAESLKHRLVGPFPGRAGLFGQLASTLQELLWLQMRDASPAPTP